MSPEEERFYDGFRPSGGAFLSEQPSYIQALVAAAYANALALADVRTLDNSWCCYDGPQRGRWYVVQGNVVALHKQPQDVYPPQFFEGPTPDAARRAAAEWVRAQVSEP